MQYNIVAAEKHRAKLELETPFGEPELKTSYRRLIHKWHPERVVSQPDAHALAMEEAKDINVAYELLSEILEANGGTYRIDVTRRTTADSSSSTSNPRRSYRGKTYMEGFPRSSVTEIFLKSSNILSTGYNQSNEILFIKCGSNRVYRYFGVPQAVFKLLS
jgi:curved DNA-binding protein CbpA